MKTRRLLSIFTLLAAGLGHGSAATYSFINLVDNTGDFALFHHCAAINQSGVVAFRADRDSCVSGIYRTDGTNVTTIVDDSTNTFSFRPFPFSLESRPAIDDDGTVAFFIYYFDGELIHPSVWTGQGGAPTFIAKQYSNPDIRNGAVSFDGSPPPWPTSDIAVFRAPASGGPPQIVVRTGDQFSVLGGTAINAAGQIAFEAGLTNGPEGIFVAGTTGITTIVTTEVGSPLASVGSIPKISDSGVVVFFAQDTNGNYGVFYGSGGALIGPMTLPGGDPIGDLGTFPSINTAGTVLCYGRLPDNRHAILAGTGTRVEVVIAEGDPLFGSTVSFLDEPGSHSLNNAGQIVFGYELENGVSGLAIATPITTPPAEPPQLSILRTATNTVVVSWPLAGADGWVLEAANALPGVAVPWPVVPPYQTSGANLQFTEPALVGNKFYRLHKP